MAAGLATLEGICTPGFFDALADKTLQLVHGLKAVAAESGVPFTTNAIGGMFGIFFTPQNAVTRFEHVMACDTGRFNRFFHRMLAEGVYLAPSAFEAGFVSAAHDDAVINATIEAARRAFREL
jgi:glutamate-1-semialdehyde 2,1-aminomutase